MYKVGDYVRTECGIAKIKSFQLKSKEIIILDKDIMFCNMDIYRNCCNINQVIKSSPRIKDLIQDGDYVNGCKVVIINNIKHLETRKGLLFLGILEQIKSIVTKEQFESMQYEVGE